MPSDFNENCIICFSNEHNGDPLIKFCQCTSSYLHENCFKKWFNMQRRDEKSIHENVTSSMWKECACFTCKKPASLSMKDGKKQFFMYDYNRKNTNSHYILLESLPLEKNTSRMFHLLEVGENGVD